MVMIKARHGPVNEGGVVKNTCFVGSKVAKTRFAYELPNNVDTYVCGTWDARVNRLALAYYYHGANVYMEEMDFFHMNSTVAVPASVNDLVVEEKNIIVAGLENGDIQVVAMRNNELITQRSIPNVHEGNSSTAVCVCDGEIISGSSSGSLMRMDLGGASRPSVLSMGNSAVHAMAVCSPFEFASAHGSGQIHLWDLRQVNPALVTGEMPVLSKAVAPLNDSVVSLCSHPAQPNILAFGTRSGSIAFADIRQPNTPVGTLLKISQCPITEVKFHPIFGGNCFALSNEGLLHLDVAEGKGTSLTVDNLSNMWLTGSTWNLVNLNTLLADDPKLPSTFDVSPHSIVCGTDTGFMALLTRMRFL